ncbi:hypothetical protein ACFU7Y_28005 [Kitasatospora sp. NPDC057542]|nr:hypothetical protein [Streptomyces sp. LS1784]
MTIHRTEPSASLTARSAAQMLSVTGTVRAQQPGLPCLLAARHL